MVQPTRLTTGRPLLTDGAETVGSPALAAEDLEGLGDDQPASWGDYPIDTLLIRNETRTAHDVLRRIDGGAFVMDPDFQRDFIWDADKQSKLVESVVMRIPLPVFYFAEDHKARLVVVDGLQRLTTFQRFVKNELVLRLKDRPELNGRTFEDLPPKLQNRVEDCNLILYVIDAKVPEQARLDIFERVNGGVPLSRQQMRNCLYMGSATRFLKEESRTKSFLEATGGSLRTSNMRDREFVNRFCAFQLLDLERYRDMDDFLADSLKAMNEGRACLPTLSSQFRTTLENNLLLFSRHAFRKHEPRQDRRGVLNASLWDVMSTGLSHYPRQVVEEKAEDVRRAFFELMTDGRFLDSITRGPNDVNQVRRRFEIAHEGFRRVFDA